MRKTSILALPLAAALALSMSACGGSPGSPGAGGSNSLVVFGPSSWDTFAPGASPEVVKQVTDELDKRFKASNPDVSISHDARGTVSDGLSRLSNAQLAGEQIDVIVCALNPVHTAYVERNLIAPLDGVAAKIKPFLNDGALDPATIDGKVWAAPLSGVSSTFFYYNKDAFAKAGIEVPKTFAEFQAAGEKLKAVGYEPIVHQGKNAWMWPMYFMQAFAQTSDGKQLEKTKTNLQGTTKFTDKEDVEALKLAQQYVTSGLIDKTSMDLDEEGMRTRFISGQAAAYFGGSWDVPVLESNVKNFEWGVFQYPKFAGQPGPVVGFGGVEVGLCLSKNSKNPELAKKYIEFAVQPEQAKLTLEPTRPIATSHKDVVGGMDPISTQIREEFLPSQMFLDWVWPRELGETFQREVQSLMNGKSAEEVAAAIQDKYDQMASRGYKFNG